MPPPPPTPPQTPITDTGTATMVTTVTTATGTPPAQSQEAWDADRIYACVCDSAWPVGFGAGETQLGEWFGPDCSLRKFRALPVPCLKNLKFAPVIMMDTANAVSTELEHPISS